MAISAPRTTKELMTLVLIELDDGAHDVTNHIRAATSLVDRIATEDPTVDSELLIEIETWLACHFYKVSSQHADTEKAGPVSEKKQFYVAHGLQTTMWGTQAVLLDPTGLLANLNASLDDPMAARKPSMKFVGGCGNRRLNNT